MSGPVVVITGTQWNLRLLVQQDGAAPSWTGATMEAQITDEGGRQLIVPWTPVTDIGGSWTAPNGFTYWRVFAVFTEAVTDAVTYFGPAVVQLKISIGGVPIGIVSTSFMIRNGY